MRGVFVTGTDTGVGKTFVSAAIAAALRAAGRDVGAFKPAVTGLDEPSPDGVPMDHELVGGCAGVSPGVVAPLTFAPAVSPHLAASMAGVEISRDDVLASYAAACDGHDVMVVEGVGGLLVPMSMAWSVRDFAVDIGLPVVIAARPALGTINHTLLTIESARSVGLDVRGVVMGPWPDEPSVMERDNRRTVAELSGVEVVTIPALTPEPEQLAAAGAQFPLDRWTA